MNLNKSLSLLTLVAFSASVAACGTPSNSVDLTAVDQGASALAAKKADPYKGLEAGAIIKGEFIVKFKPGAKQTNAISGAESIKSLDSSAKSGLALVKMTDVNKNSVGTNSNILWSEPNRVVRLPNDIKEAASKTDAAPYMNDEKYSEQYSHQITHSEAGWDAIKNTKVNDLTIAIVDTGVDAEHPDLKAKMVAGYDVYNPTTPASAGRDPQGHGTHCAGIAGAIGDNKIGVAGVSFQSNIKIQPVRVLNDQGSGTLADVATGILWAGSHGAKVLSMSLGGPSSSKAMEDAVKVALDNDVLVIAASGNSYPRPIGAPANVKGVMAVGATDSADKIASFSQQGTGLSVSAPGVKIMSTFPTYANGIGQTNYGSISGTSMATPFVSGLAGLVRAVNPALSATQVRELIEKNATDLGTSGFDPVFGHGRVDVEKTLKAALARKK